MDSSTGGQQGRYMGLYAISGALAHVFGHNLGLRFVERFGFDAGFALFSAIGLVGIYLLLGVRTPQHRTP